MRSDASDVRLLLDRLPAHGLGTRRQWLDAGATHRMFEDGRLLRVARGLYAADGVDVSVERLAALLPEEAVIGGWAAAVAFGFRDAGPAMQSPTAQPVPAYLARADHRSPAGFAVRRSTLLPGEQVVVDGVRVTSPARTAYDLARFATGVRSATGSVDAARWPGATDPVTPEQLAAMLAAHPNGKGNPQLRSAVELSTGRARSFAESDLRVRWVRDADVPPARLMTNATLHLERGTLELDLVDLSAGLVVEYDGEHHAASAQRSRDAHKDAVLDDLGLGHVRCNAAELALGAAAFSAWARGRRAAAIAKGAPERIARLVRSARLREEPLTLY
ncbi:DUF2726 domain-containing protein [Cumulibacter manganitolerans]|uniref:DUF2726 domain-containing protein n=1 Tax=Cumulibacter manganitolerans TaxID=1884992 RepID=UPI001297B21D|nr:hypothetical protein [Cumulibacter manganitolerans]